MDQDFDLNIKRILTTWEVSHACRELAANALDEHVLCKLDPKSVTIRLHDDHLMIKDLGRGVEKFHFVQDENEEKDFTNPKIIGQFGFGLKDAVAVLVREERTLEIKSKHGRYTFEYRNKHGHDDVITLHVIIHKDVQSDFVGTEISIHPISEEELNKTKSLFLMFSKREVLFECHHGQVLSNDGENSSIYVKGLRVDENQSYHFSYNIHAPSKALREKMSRDKNSVSMGVYSTIIKRILTSITKHHPLYQVIEKLILHSDSKDLSTDIGYKDITVHFTKNMENKIIVTKEQIEKNPMVFEEIKSKVQIVTNEQYNMISRSGDRKCKNFEDIVKIGQEHGEEITYNKMSVNEKATFDAGNEVIRSNPDIFGLLSVPKIVRNLTLRGLKVSGTQSNDEIYIDYEQLKRGGCEYFGTLVHEHAHKKSHAEDCTREFESCLTHMLGKCVNRFIVGQPPAPKRRKLASRAGAETIEID